MKEKYPDFVKKLEAIGLIYMRILGAGDDRLLLLVGAGTQPFLTIDKNIAEERFAKFSIFYDA